MRVDDYGLQNAMAWSSITLAYSALLIGSTRQLRHGAFGLYGSIEPATR